MEFIRAEIPDIILIDPLIHTDERGYFIETYREDKLQKVLGYKINFCQDHESRSHKNVLRGLHFQIPPFEQTKLVRVVQGAALDKVVFALGSQLQTRMRLIVEHKLGNMHGTS